MTTGARKGVGALLLAYIILFLVTGAVVAAVLLGREKNEATVRLTLTAPQSSGTVSSSAPVDPAKASPPPQTGAAAVVALPPPPVPIPPAPVPVPVPAAEPPVPEPVKPEPQQAAVPAPEPTQPPPLASTYPPPPPEKPAPPAKTATATPAPAQGRGMMPAALLEGGPHGPLPRIAADGRLPWIVNNAKFDHGTRQPRLGIVLTGLGLSPQVTEDAIIRLPPEITLAFVPHTENLQRWILLAREFGHEVLISLPMEGDGPSDGGPSMRILSTKVGPGENIDRLRWALGRASGYVGIVTWEGEKFLADAGAATPVLQELAQRGLLVMDSREAKSNIVQQQADTLGLPFAKSRGFLDSEPGVATLDRNLQQLEAIAKRSGFALAMAVAFPDTVTRLIDWSKTVPQRGFVLAPVSGVTECKELCQRRVARHAEAVSSARR
jgi:polysaccharide deacetylase 2 family uncharacterized protein YibQ